MIASHVTVPYGNHSNALAGARRSGEDPRLGKGIAGKIWDIVGAIRCEGDMEGTLSSRLTMIVLPDADGKEIRMGSLWATQPAVVVFLRHYG